MWLTLLAVLSLLIGGASLSSVCPSQIGCRKCLTGDGCVFIATVEKEMKCIPKATLLRHRFVKVVSTLDRCPIENGNTSFPQTQPNMDRKMLPPISTTASTTTTTEATTYMPGHSLREERKSAEIAHPFTLTPKSSTIEVDKVVVIRSKTFPPITITPPAQDTPDKSFGRNSDLTFPQFRDKKASIITTTTRTPATPVSQGKVLDSDSQFALPAKNHTKTGMVISNDIHSSRSSEKNGIVNRSDVQNNVSHGSAASALTPKIHFEDDDDAESSVTLHLPQKMTTTTSSFFTLNPSNGDANGAELFDFSFQIPFACNATDMKNKLHFPRVARLAYSLCRSHHLINKIKENHHLIFPSISKWDMDNPAVNFPRHCEFLTFYKNNCGRKFT